MEQAKGFCDFNQFVLVFLLSPPCVRIVVASNFQLEEARNEKKFHNII